MTARGRVRRRHAVRVANRRADWEVRVAVPVGRSGVTAVLALPLLRRLRHDPELVERIGRAALAYRATYRVPRRTGEWRQ